MASSGGQHEINVIKKPNFSGNEPAEKINMNELMDKMIGYNKQKFSNVIVPPNKLNIPPQDPQERRIVTIFESCPFKTTMSAGAGKSIT